MEEELKEIPGMQPEQVVVIKKFSYADKSRLSGKIFTMKANNIDTAEIDIGAYKIYALVYGISRAPFFIPNGDRLQELESLSVETGDYLFNKVVKFNNLGNIDEIKKK